MRKIEIVWYVIVSIVLVCMIFYGLTYGVWT